MTAAGRKCARRAGEHVGAVTFDILVQPRASRAKLGPVHDGRVKVAVTSPPVDGEANAAVIELLAEALGVGKRAVTVVAGHASRRKTIRVDGITRDQLDELVTDDEPPIDEDPE